MFIADLGIRWSWSNRPLTGPTKPIAIKIWGLHCLVVCYGKLLVGWGATGNFVQFLLRHSVATASGLVFSTLLVSSLTVFLLSSVCTKIKRSRLVISDLGTHNVTPHPQFDHSATALSGPSGRSSLAHSSGRDAHRWQPGRKQHPQTARSGNGVERQSCTWTRWW